MNSGGRRTDNAQKASLPLNSYQFDFGLGSNFSSSQPIKSLKDQKYSSPTPTQVPSSAQSQKPALTPNKPSWTPQPSFTSSATTRASPSGVSSGWSAQSGISGGQPQMTGDIFGKSWSKPDSSIGIVGGVNPGAAPHLFGDLLGAALGQQSSNAPLKQSGTTTSFSMGSMSSALPKGGISLKDQQRVAAVRSTEDFGGFVGVNSGGKGSDPFDDLPTFSNIGFKSSHSGSSAKKTSLKSTNSGVSPDPFGEFGNVSGTSNADNMKHAEDSFPSFHKDDAFGDFQKGSSNQSSTVGGDPFTASANVSNDLSGGISATKSSDRADFSFGASSDRNSGTRFADPLSSFSSSAKQGTASGRVADPFEALNRSFSSQKQAPRESSMDPLGSLFSSSSTASKGDFGGQTVLESQDWGVDTDFGGTDMGPTTELEGLPPPPAGINISIAKDKGMESYKQGQFADAIKWLSWAMVLIEKSGDGGNGSKEVLICRASCYKEVGEYKKAVADCSKVLEHDKSNVAVLLQRALLYESTEKYKLGVADLRNALKLDPANRLAKNTLSRLAKLAD